MPDYKEKLDELHRAARRKAREIEEKFAISDLVEEGARAAEAAAKRGADTVANGAERIKAEAERLANDPDVNETAKRAAGGAVRSAMNSPRKATTGRAAGFERQSRRAPHTPSPT